MGFRLRDTAALPWSCSAAMGMDAELCQGAPNPKQQAWDLFPLCWERFLTWAGQDGALGYWGKCFSRDGRVWAGQGDRGRNGCFGSGQVHSLICDGLNPHLAQSMGLTWESCSSAVREPQPGTDNRQVPGDICGLSPPLDLLRAGRAVTQRN